MGLAWFYKARDTHLDRFVAINVLPPEKVADAERKRRFVQEAKSASALNHPNIITIHDIASDNGLDFIAMEYVPGKAPDQVIARRGRPLAEALKYAVQIADLKRLPVRRRLSIAISSRAGRRLVWAVTLLAAFTLGFVDNFR